MTTDSTAAKGGRAFGWTSGKKRSTARDIPYEDTDITAERAVEAVKAVRAEPHENANYPVVALDAELLVHRIGAAMRCPAGTPSWELLHPAADPRLGTVLRVRRCKLDNGHDGAH